MFACGSSERSTETPIAAAAETRQAQQAFRRLYARWTATPLPRRQVLKKQLQRFMGRFPGDPKARLVRLYLAWLDVESGQLDRAAATARADRRNPPGTAADLGTVIEAAVLSRRNRADEALALLEPLRGKVVDPDDRVLYGGELVRAALAARRYAHALSYMLDWAEQAGGEQETVKTSIVEQVRTIPVSALERAMPGVLEISGGQGAASNDAQRWLARTVRDQLIRAALGRRDVALAKRLLDSIPTSLRMDETREALRRLAAHGRVAPRISGRSIGLVLELGGLLERRRSAEVAAGMSRALDLVRAPADSEAVHLLSREAASAADVEGALSALAGEGAAVLVAGVVEQSAERAASFAERSRIPVVVLTVPATPPPGSGFAFVAGEPEGASATVLASTLGARGKSRLVQVGPGGTVSCDGVPVSAGQSRFPIVEWKKSRVDGLVITGDRACAIEVLGELQGARLAVGVALGLEAAPLYSTADAGMVIAASAGRYPPLEADAGTSWFSALGADVARLASATLESFPLDQTLDDEAVAELHRKARDELARASAPLETTDTTGFSGARRLERTVRAIERGTPR